MYVKGREKYLSRFCVISAVSGKGKSKLWRLEKPLPAFPFVAEDEIEEEEVTKTYTILLPKSSQEHASEHP